MSTSFVQIHTIIDDEIKLYLSYFSRFFL